MSRDLQKDKILEKIELECFGLNEKPVKIENPLLIRSQIDRENPALHLLRIMRDPNYFYFTCKMLMNGPNGKPLRLFPYQAVIMREMWYRSFPMLVASRGAGKSFILGLYALLRALFMQGRRIVITGSGFRQAKTVFVYAETIWWNSPILRSLVAENVNSGPHHGSDRWEMIIGESKITALPMGDGTKIRGERANDVIADEFASIPREVFETVIAGFGVVELDPWDRVEQEARIRILKKEKLWTASMEEEMRKTRVGNQTVISGTAYYQFNHFADYWKLWKGIILSKGDQRTLDMLFPNGINENFDWRDYSVMRLPVELLPPGYMDARQVARSKATQHSGTFLNEFGAVFSSDSNGFFKRSLVESCVTNEPIIVEGVPVQFKATTKGNPNMKYIFGIDPASEVDKFSIVIIEVHETHRRIVYCWTTTSEAHRQRLRARATQEADFYAYCARKIRDLMKVFPCEVISMDAMGGGIAVAEALHDSGKLYPGEKMIWPITMDHPLSDGKERDSDAYSGLHIIEMVNFAKFEYTADANHGMRKDFEDKVLLFPQYDTGLLALAMEDDNLHQRVYDTLEDCVQEIEELKEELATIVHTQTPNTNRDRWDTPEIKIAGSRKGRLRKDRYSALLMANAAARRLARQHEGPAYEPLGGWVGQISTSTGDEMYIHVPEWWQKGVQTNMDGYGWVHRGSGVRDDSSITMQSNLYPSDM